MFFLCIPEEGQRICVAAFPIIKTWLQISLPHREIFQPVCSFIAMTVANNCKLCVITCAKLRIFCVYISKVTLKCSLFHFQLLFVSAACVQESFSAYGGLETLTLILVRLVSGTEISLLSCQLSVTICKTLSACITENCVYCTHRNIHINCFHKQLICLSIHNLFFAAPLASGLAQYDVVSHLFSLLASPNLDPKDRPSVLLTIGHCTEASRKTALC